MALPISATAIDALARKRIACLGLIFGADLKPVQKCFDAISHLSRLVRSVCNNTRCPMHQNQLTLSAQALALAFYRRFDAQIKVLLFVQHALLVGRQRGLRNLLVAALKHILGTPADITSMVGMVGFAAIQVLHQIAIVSGVFIGGHLPAAIGVVFATGHGMRMHALGAFVGLGCSGHSHRPGVAGSCLPGAARRGFKVRGRTSRCLHLPGFLGQVAPR